MLIFRMEFFAILNLDRSASQRDVEKSFKNLARRFHPDKSGDIGDADEARQIFEQCNLAAAILSNQILYQVGHCLSIHRSTSYKL